MATIQYTDRGAAVRVSPASKALTRAVLAALEAPSIHDTQPWRWRIDHDTAELRADRSCQLPAIDPDGRLLTLSCGIALHHARIALAADGGGAEVRHLPDVDDPDLLATLRYTGRIERSAETQRMRRAMGIRRTDWRPFADQPVPEAAIDLLSGAVEAFGAHLRYVRARDLVDVVDGIEVDDRNARYAVLFTDADLPQDWMTAGEALSAVLLTATAEGLAASPAGDLAEIIPARTVLRRVLGDIGHPAVVVRVGLPGQAQASPQSPRRPSTSVVELIADPIEVSS